MDSTTSEAIAVTELVVLSSAFALALLACFRQGFIFAIIRMAGTVIEILSQRDPTNTSDAGWFGILSSICLSPLLLASIGLLKRAEVH